MNFDNCTPCIIIGAGRSGTNMLRDILCSYPGISTWPCDEINYIWRYGNRAHPTDQFTPELANPRAKQYIQGAFSAQATKSNCRVLVEKTCANSLRVGFVEKVVPQAKYVAIYRDGRNVVPSAIKRWQASLDLAYIVRKARFVPARDVPYYSCRYIGHRIKKIFSSKRALPTWGPVYDGMREHAGNYSVEELCAAQWAQCVSSTLDDLAEIDSSRVCTVKYEALQQDPKVELQRVLRFVVGAADIDLNLTAGLAKKIRTTGAASVVDKLELRTSVRDAFDAQLQRLDYQ